MSRIKKYGTKLNLDSYRTFIDDTDPNSFYLKINEFKDVFTGGKNGFVIEGTPYLKRGTEVKIEITDVRGEPVYVELGKGIPDYYEGLSVVTSTFIYDDTPIGEANITILAELEYYLDEFGIEREVPDEWKGVYNLKWKRRFTINKNFPNEDKVRFYYRPRVDIDEIVKPIFNIEVPFITQSGSVIGVPELPQGGFAINNYAGGTLYRLVSTDGPNFTASIQDNIIQIPSLNYSASVVDVINDTTIIVDKPYTVRRGLFDIISPFSSSEYTSTFEYFENPIIDETDTLTSFGKFKLKRLNTFVGDVGRVKVYRKSRSLLEDYQLVQDLRLESTELLIDYETTSSNDVYYGNFYEDNLYKYWTSGSNLEENTHLITPNSSILNNSIKIEYDSSEGGITYLYTNDDLDLTQDTEYTLQFNLLYTGGISDTAYIKAYMSSSTFVQDIGTFKFKQQYYSKEIINVNFISQQTTQSKLVFEIVGDSTNIVTPSPIWYISSVSLKAAEETALSPDELTFIQQIPRKLFNETFDFKFEFYDINNNLIPVEVRKSKQFTGGNDFQAAVKRLDVSTNKSVFTFIGNTPSPTVQGDILFTVTRTGYTGSTTFASSAFDDTGNLIPEIGYLGGQYPGLLTDITDTSATLTLANFTGSDNSIKVSNIVYTVNVDNDFRNTSIFRLSDGQSGVGLSAILTAENVSFNANSVGAIIDSLDKGSGSVILYKNTELLEFDELATDLETLSNNKFRFTVTGSNVTPISGNPTINNYGITDMSSDDAQLFINIDYKDIDGNIVTIPRRVSYTKLRINAPQITLDLLPKTQTVTACNTGLQIGTIQSVQVRANEIYTGSLQTREIETLTSSKTCLSKTPIYTVGNIGLIDFDGGLIDTNIDSVILSVTASVFDSEGTNREVFDTINISKTKGGKDGCDGPGVFYQGGWDLNKCYYHNAIRRDVVSWGNCYWQTNCIPLDTCCGYWWQEPSILNDRWRSFGCTLASVATDILFAEDVYSNRTINIGMKGGSPVIAMNADYTNNGANPSIRITSTGYNTNGIFIGYDGGTPKVSFKSPTNYLLWDGTNLSLSGNITANALSANAYIESPTIDAGTITSTYLNATTICASNFCTSNFRGGTICASSVYASFISGSSICGGCIGSNCIFGSYINGSCICGGTMRIGSNPSVFTIDTNGIYLGCENFVCAPFSVSPTGFLKATNACIVGCIFTSCIASSDWYSGTITGANITIGTAPNIFKANDWGIWLGNASCTAAPFSVSMAGALKATNATISGNITANAVNIGTDDYWNSNGTFRLGGDSGISYAGTGLVYIGSNVDISGNITANALTANVTITTPSISGGTITGTTIQIGCGTSVFKADTCGIYLGNTDCASAPFKVSPAGVLSATGVDITGNIKADNLCINNACISGILYVGELTGVIRMSQGTIRSYAWDVFDPNIPGWKLDPIGYQGTIRNAPYVDATKVGANCIGAQCVLSTHICSASTLCAPGFSINTTSITMDTVAAININDHLISKNRINVCTNLCVCGDAKIVGNLYVCGATGGTAVDWIATSDLRLKHNIKRMCYGLCDIMNLKPVHYTMRDDNTNTPRIGFIAQQVKPFIPEVVVGDCMLGINYPVMVSVLTSAIQQQQSQIEQLRLELCCLKRG